MSSADRAMGYTTTIGPLPGSKAARVPVPSTPDEASGTKRVHHVGGTIAGVRVRSSIRKHGGGLTFSVSLCDRPIAAGDVVNVVISRRPAALGLGGRFAGVLEASPDAGAFFDSLAQFFRKGYQGRCEQASGAANYTKDRGIAA